MFLPILSNANASTYLAITTCRANQLTGFYIMETLVVKGLASALMSIT